MSLDLHQALGGRGAPADVGALSQPVRTVPAGTPCGVVDAAFRADDDLVCLAVDRADATGRRRYGLVSRAAFMSRMVGRLGYGRLVHARHPVASLTDWDALVLPSTTTVKQAARRILERERADRYSEVLVLGDGVSYLEVEDVLRALGASLSQQALTDQLTGLANRRQFLQVLRAALADMPADRVAVAYVDVDGFKAINDGFGHAVGDQVLQQVAQRLRSCVRPGDVVARLGGDEFALLVRLAAPRTQQVGPGQELAERLLGCLAEPVQVAGRVLPGRVSIGVVVAEGSGVDPDALLHEADLAMYSAKAAGGSRCAVVDGVTGLATTAAHAPDRGELQRALAAGEFVVAYQPIVEVLSGRLRSTEALVRWQHPTRGLLAPASFLDDITTAGLATDLDEYVLRAALAQQARWCAEHGPHAPDHVNVNLSVPALLRDDLAAAVLAELGRAGLAPGVLRLELPEVATPAHVRAAGASLRALRAAGVGVTLDDVGAGAAGLSHLADLHLDGVKIDRRFVAGMLTDERDAAVVRMLIEMAHGLEIAVIAEGAESEAHLDLLRVLARGRPTHVQGYVISVPRPADELSSSWSKRQTAHAHRDHSAV